VPFNISITMRIFSCLHLKWKPSGWRSRMRWFVEYLSLH
jgi:hypothetical protein